MLIDHVIGGKYRITELIGQGGMGTVFEAVHTGTHTRVAIKLIVSSDIKEEVFVRFQREARAAGTIDSQHIVRIFDMGTDERSGSPYMVMERLYGEDLSQLMRRVGPLCPETALALIAQAAMGLAKAHESGVVHRDIKPANIFLHDVETGDCVVKILDFGIAKVLQDVMQRAEEGGLTRTGSMLGSPHYMSPEQAQGLRSIDHRSDIWSLGVVLYKMLTGQTPHAHLTTLGQVILAICSQPPRPVQELSPWVPPSIAEIVHRALQADPGRRFQSAYEMYSAMQPLLAGVPPVRRASIAPLSNADRARVAPALPRHAMRQEMITAGTGATGHGLVHTADAVPPPQRSGRGVVIAMAALGVMAAVGIAGIGASVMAKKPAAAATPAPQAPEPTEAATVVPIPAPPPTGDGTTTAGSVAPGERTVKLAVSPPNASVEIDGQKAVVVDGSVDITGPLGAIVKVQVAANGASTTHAIAITEGGAMPPRIALATPTHGPKTPGKQGGPSAGPKTAPTGTESSLNAQRNFE